MKMRSCWGSSFVVLELLAKPHPGVHSSFSYFGFRGKKEGNSTIDSVVW